MTMTEIKPFHRWLPYLIAILTFASVCLVCFAPLTEGKRLQTHDVTQYQGMQADIQKHRAQYGGEDPQWAGGMFGGMPAYLINVKYDSLFFRTAMNAVDNLCQPASLIMIAMLGFFCMMLLCGVNPWPAIAPSLAYGLSTYFFLIIGAGHITKIVAMAYAPLMLGGVFYAFRRDMWLGAALTALFAALEIAGQHPQITYYFGLILVAFWINELYLAIREKWLARFAKTTGLLLVAAVMALGANFIGLYNIQKHSKYTTRGGSELATAEANPKGLDIEYATGWSYGIGESLNLFVPDFQGGGSSTHFKSDGPVDKALAKYNARYLTQMLPVYWGDQPITGGPTYLGAVAIFMAVAGLFLLRGRTKWWVLAVSVVALMLSWGHNMMWFTRLFFDYFPGYDKFRTVSMILVILEWSVPFLAGLFLYKLWKGDAEPARVRKALLNALYVTGGVALALVLFAGMFDFTAPVDAQLKEQLPGDILEAMRKERGMMMRADAWRSLIFCVITWGVLWVMAKGKMKRGLALAAVAVLVCVDLIPVNMRFLPWSSFTSPRKTATVQPTEADKRIMADTTPGFRVANFSVSTFNDATTSYFHRSVGGYHGAKLQRYQDVIDRYLSRNNEEVFNMLDTRYYILPGENGAPPEEVYNPDANGAAWFVHQVEYVETPDQELDALGKIDTKTTAVVDRRFDEAKAAVNIPVDTTATIALTDYRVNRLTYEYASTLPQMAVFSEIYYPEGWTATIDGQPLDYFRADYILRAAVLPAGEHTVVFSFAVPHYKLHSAITLAFSIAILLCVIAALAVPKFLCKKDGTERK